MKANDVLNILHDHQQTWLLIAARLLYKDDEQTTQDIVQDMYIRVYDYIIEGKLQPNNVIINNKPHFGLIKIIILRIIQHQANNENRLPKDDNCVLNNIVQDEVENIEEITTRIEEILQDMHWFDRKLFNLYVKKFNSVRKLSKETKLGHVTVYNTIKKCRNNIKKKLNEK